MILLAFHPVQCYFSLLSFDNTGEKIRIGAGSLFSTPCSFEQCCISLFFITQPSTSMDGLNKKYYLKQKQLTSYGKLVLMNLVHQVITDCFPQSKFSLELFLLQQETFFPLQIVIWFHELSWISDLNQPCQLQRCFETADF